jgi:hypothetical protein
VAPNAVPNVAPNTAASRAESSPRSTSNGASNPPELEPNEIVADTDSDEVRRTKAKAYVIRALGMGYTLKQVPGTWIEHTFGVGTESSKGGVGNSIKKQADAYRRQRLTGMDSGAE